MDSIEAVGEGEWNSDMSGICISEESDFLSQFLINSSSLWPAHSMNMASAIDGASYYSSEPCNSNLLRFSHSGSHFLNPDYLSKDSQSSIFENLRSTESYYPDGGDRFLQTVIQSNTHEKNNLKNTESESGFLEKSKKRCLSSEIVRSKKNQKIIYSSRRNEEDQSSSEDDSNGSQDSVPPKSLNLIGKKRANRGSATDPQSLYARKRRERINERLRTLQSLVPNGKKVDLSTMLEEAVQYVKFLQLQIKLLSSDDLWMYAPIAYNGMDLGLNTRQS